MNEPGHSSCNLYMYLYVYFLSISDEGKTTFMVKMVNEKILLFHYFNQDRKGKVTRVAGILGEFHTWNSSFK